MHRLPLERRWRERGATSVEYVLLVAFIALAVAFAIGLLGIAVLDLFTGGVEEIPWEG